MSTDRKTPHGKTWRPLLLGALVSGLALMGSAPAHAQQDDKRAAREKEALRRSQQALRSAQEQAAQLQAEKIRLESQGAQIKAEAAKETEAALAQVRGTKGALAKAQADVQRLTQELAAVRAEQAKEREDAITRIEGLSSRLAQAQRSLAERTESAQNISTLLERSMGALTQAEDKNRQLVTMNRQLIGMYRDKGFKQVLAQKEPVLGLRDVQVENEAEALRTQVEALRVTDAAAEPMAPAAGAR